MRQKIYRSLLRIALFLRYSIHYKGLEDVTKAKKNMLFLCNLTSEIDPLLIYLILSKKIKVKAILPKRLFSFYWLKRLFERLGGYFVIPYDQLPSKLQIKRLTEETNKINEEMNRGENFIFFPKGKLMISPFDGYNYTILSAFLEKQPPANIAIVTIKGMLGSSFSHKMLGVDFSYVKSISACLKTILKNLIFFMPKRKVFIEFSLPEKEFPLEQDTPIIMSYLDMFFNRELGDLKSDEKGLFLVPHYFWKKKVDIKPLVAPPIMQKEDIPKEIQQQVIEEIARLVNIRPEEISPKDDLYEDLGLNSLDVTELVIFLEEYFNQDISFESIRTVGDVILGAIGRENKARFSTEVGKRNASWFNIKDRKETAFPEAKTIIESFFKTCDRMDGSYACVDLMGIMSFYRMKSFVLGLAEEFKNLPGDKVGILLPPCAFMNIAVLALMLVKKVPVLMNWSLGPQNLAEVVSQTKMKVILSEEWLIDKKLGFPLPKHIEELVFPLEGIRDELTFDKRKEALSLSRKKADEILSFYKLKNLKEDDIAAILFTTGTEKKPKGVPLSHKNILKNQISACKTVEIVKTDVMMGILPSFHAFGFSITNLLPLTIGARVVFLMNTLDLKHAGELINTWKVTVLCATPTFFRILLSITPKEKLQSLRLAIMGAEALSQELIAKAKELLPNTKVVEGYGVTEGSPILALNKIDSERRGVGFPIDNVEIKIVDVDDFHEVGCKEKGLVIARGPNIFDGYLLNEGKDPFIKIDGKKWYNTQDLGYIEEDGSLHLIGRLSRSVKKGGELISLVAMEEVILHKLMGDKDLISKDKPLHVGIVGKENERNQIELALFCNYPITLERANSCLQEAGFSNLFRLNRVVVLDELPLFATGKTNYRKLDELF